MSKTKKILSVILAVLMLMSVSPIAFAEDTEVSITHQPTAAEPYVELNDSTDVTYQWYKVGESFEITDLNADTYSYGGAESSYSAENGWTGIVSEYGIPTYFTIPLEAGEKVTVEVIGDNLGFIELFDRDLWYSTSVSKVNGKTTYELTIDYAGVYTFFTEYAATVKARSNIAKTTYSKLDGETSATLNNPEFGETYVCKVTTADSTVLKTEEMEYVYAITHQPSATEPYVELNDSTDAVYQWYTAEEVTFEITDKNATGSWVSLGAPEEMCSVYDPEKGWIGYVSKDYAYYFLVELEAGDTLELEFSSMPDEIGYAGDYELIDISSSGTIVSVTAAYGGTYGFGCLNTEITVKAYLNRIEYTAVDGENAAELKNPEFGNKYVCEVTFADGTTEMSDVVDYSYKITHQPTAAEPYVELNDDTDAAYQWYDFKEDTVEFTDANTQAYSYNGETASYNSETGWTPVLDEDDFYSSTTIALNKGDTVTVVFEESGFDSLGFWDYETNDEGAFTYEKDGVTTYELTIDADGTYTIYTGNAANYKVYLVDKTYTKLDGETKATLTTTEDGTYFCEVTFKDGTKEQSETFTPCAHTDTDGDGICDNDCGYEDPAENTDSDVCDYCGKVHPTFIQKLFCKITQFFVTLFTLIGLW